MKRKVLKTMMLIVMLVMLLIPAKIFAEVIDSGTCGANLHWVLDDEGTLTISGTGEMGNYYSIDLPWENEKEIIYQIIIVEGVTNIGESAFNGCSNLKNITIPNSVASIGVHAFHSCSSLTRIIIPDSVRTIGAYAFYDCSSLINIRIPDSVTSIGEAVFDSCDSLTEINVDSFNSSYQSIEGILLNKTATSVLQYPAGKADDTYVIPSSVTNIGTRAFRNCDNLKSIEIPNSVTNIERIAFAGCSNLNNIIIPDSMTNIAPGTFYSCINLSNITIPDSVISIKDEAFYHCDSLTDVYYLGSEEQWNKINIGALNMNLTDATIHFEAKKTPVSPFKDLKDGAFYYTPVLWATEKGITTGTTSTTFEPEDTCTRGQIVTFLWRAAGSPDPVSNHCSFVDVSEGSYYYKAMLWAVQNGITNGMDATHFKPNDSCTRGQVATFLWRSQGPEISSRSKNPFEDIVAGHYYYNAVLWAVENGITNGVSATAFKPEDSCTRGQIVTFLYRSMN